MLRNTAYAVLPADVFIIIIISFFGKPNVAPHLPNITLILRKIAEKK